MGSLRSLTFKAVGYYHDDKQGKDYPKNVEVTALLHNDGIVTDVIPWGKI